MSDSEPEETPVTTHVRAVPSIEGPLVGDLIASPSDDNHSNPDEQHDGSEGTREEEDPPPAYDAVDNTPATTVPVVGQGGGSTAPARLSDNVVPTAYDLHVQPDLDKATFSGNVEITITVKEATDVITLHALNLKILRASVRLAGRSFFARKFNFDDKAQTVSLNFSQTVPAGQGVLTIVFTGILNSDMAGFYRSTYVDDQGVTQVLATTQFEPADARQAFPCWDEPARKATFTITLTAPKHLCAISNMPVISEEPHPEHDDLHIVKFAETPIMSTYLVAYIVGHLEYIEGSTVNGTKLRVYTRPGRTHQGEFALDFCSKVLPFFEEYFDIPFPLPKCDLLAIPDFGSGAMENWGCVTYREVMLLIDEEKSSRAVKQRVCRVIAHEIAHSWFGNLATMEWWTHLWLNEGFARWSEHLCVDSLHPDWSMWAQFAGDIASVAYAKDALLSSHPIEVPVTGPEQLDEIFDVISYAKGASVIRMLEHYLGAQVFRDGLRQYLRNNSYSNALTEDLWHELSQASGVDVASLMRVWTEEMGFPLLSAQVLPESPQETADSMAETGVEYIKIEVTQHRFLKTQSVYDDDMYRLGGNDNASGTLWSVPVTVWHGGETSKHILTDRISVLRLPLDPAQGRTRETPIHLNADAAGFYRVRYTDDMLNTLLDAVRANTLPVMERLSLIQDLKALADCGALPMSRLLQVLLAFSDETHYSVWSAIAGAIAGALSLYREETFYPQLQRFACHVFEEIGERVGFQASEDDGHLGAMLRTTVLHVLAKAAHEPTLDLALSLFDRDNLFKPGHLPPPAVRSLVYNAVCARGGLLEFDLLMGLYRKTDFPEEQRRIMNAFGYLHNHPNLLRQVCDLALAEHVVRPQNCLQPLVSVATHSSLGREIAWEWIREHYDELTKHYKGKPNKGIISVAGMACKDEDEIKSFFSTVDITGVERSVGQIAEAARARAARIARDREQLQTFFQAYFDVASRKGAAE